MGEEGFPSLQRLCQDSSVVSAMKTLSPAEYQEAVSWIREHFTFAFGQQIDWSHDSSAVIGRIADLTWERLQRIFALYEVNQAQKVTVI